MIARPWILLSCAAAAATLLGVEPGSAQPSATPPAHPPVGLIAVDLQKLIARLTMCWDVPVAVRNSPSLAVTVRINLKRDGSLAAAPVVVNSSQAPLFPVAARSAVRAVTKCAPFGFLPADQYELWRDIEVKFDPGTLSDLTPK